MVASRRTRLTQRRAPSFRPAHEEESEREDRPRSSERSRAGRSPKRTGTLSDREAVLDLDRDPRGAEAGAPEREGSGDRIRATSPAQPSDLAGVPDEPRGDERRRGRKSKPRPLAAGADTKAAIPRAPDEEHKIVSADRTTAR